MKLSRRLFLIGLLFILSATALFPCTTAIVSGKFTRDGRPLLFKHRDTGTLDNKLMFFSDGKYEYIGLVNSPDKMGAAVWSGVNSAGFAIMNSASYNLNLKDTTSADDREGVVMKLALQVCATVDDFETLLDTLPKPLGVDANFGVIDARGGAAYFETAQYDFKKFDANDPTIAPFGYIIRTNFSFWRDADQGFGYIRFENAQQLFNLAAATGDLSHQFILQKVSRCLKHSLTGVDLTEKMPPTAKTPRFVDFNDFIPRHSSASTTVIQGVTENETPELTTMWTILGFPLCSVSIPVWVSGGEHLPSILVAADSGNALLCDWALKLKEKCFPIKRGSGKNYLNLSAVVNQQHTGFLQILLPLEDRIFSEAEESLNGWRQQEIDQKQVQQFYDWVDKLVRQEYQQKFGF